MVDNTLSFLNMKPKLVETKHVQKLNSVSSGWFKTVCHQTRHRSATSEESINFFKHRRHWFEQVTSKGFNQIYLFGHNLSSFQLPPTMHNKVHVWFTVVG